MAEMSLLQALHARAKDKTHMCMTGHVIECVSSLNTSNSTKTRNVDMSYQTSSSHKERLARETRGNTGNS